MTAQISIIMPAYNVGQFIKEAIECIIHQTFKDWELIIINDGSTDDTWDIISSFKDSRIKSFNYKENNGAGWASYKALEMIDSPYVARMDADDLCETERFEKQLLFLQKNKEVSVVRSYARFFSNDLELKKTNFYRIKKNISEPLHNERLTRAQISEKLYWYLCFVSATALMRTAVVKKVNYSPEFRLGEDYKLFYDLNKAHCVIETIPEVLYHYRVVQGSATHRHINTHSEVHYKIKKTELAKLFKNHKVYIWGTGSVAQELTTLLEQDNLKISGYLDYKVNNSSQLMPVIDYTKLNVSLHKIIIAATPVREKVVSELLSRKFKHLRDFVVFR